MVDLWNVALLLHIYRNPSLCLVFFPQQKQTSRQKQRMVFALIVKLKLKRAEDVPVLLKTIEPLRAHSTTNEPGTLTYELHRSKDCDRTVLILERYESEAALDEVHAKSEPFQAFFAALGELQIVESDSVERFDASLLPTL